MQKDSVDDELLDASPTDELPVLTEHDVVDDEESTRLFAALVDDTGRHEAVRVESDGTEVLATPRVEGEGAGLERRLTEQTQLLADRAATIASLEERLAATREAIRRREAAEQALRAAMAEHEQRQDTLAAALDQARARAAELERAAKEQARELEAARAEVESKARAEQDLLDWLVGEEQAREALARDLADSRQEAETLAAAVAEAGRRADALAADLEATRAGLAALGERAEAVERRAVAEHEAGDALAHTRAEAAALAAYIDNRRSHWEAQRAELAEREATIEELRGEIEQRARRQQEAEAVAAAERRRGEALGRERDALRLELDTRRRGPAPEPPGEREHEIERLREEVEALRTRAAAEQSERERHAAGAHELQRRADEASAELAQAKVLVAHLERTLLERDRVIDTQNVRIESLQAQVGTRSGRFKRLDAEVQDGSDAGEPRRTTPVLVCLTGEAPRSFRLGKPAMTIGRSAHCEIQIVTQFVSREHARLEIEPDGVVIEDLESKNGVFVNAVRVERETLRHGDLVTVGETQFRFLGE